MVSGSMRVIPRKWGWNIAMRGPGQRSGLTDTYMWGAGGTAVQRATRGMIEQSEIYKILQQELEKERSKREEFEEKCKRLELRARTGSSRMVQNKNRLEEDGNLADPEVKKAYEELVRKIQDMMSKKGTTSRGVEPAGVEVSLAPSRATLAKTLSGRVVKSPENEYVEKRRLFEVRKRKIGDVDGSGIGTATKKRRARFT